MMYYAPFKTSTTEKDKINRRIRFDSKLDSIILVDSRFDYTADERSSTWYTPAECRSFKAQYVRETLENTTARRLDFERAKRIEAVRHLLIEAQDAKRKQACRKLHNNTGGEDIGMSVVGSYSRWLADFYKHHSDACVNAAISRGKSNANEKWSVQEKLPSQQQSHTCDCAVKPVKRLSLTLQDAADQSPKIVRRRSSDFFDQKQEQSLKMERWSAHGPSSKSTSLKGDKPMKPTRVLTPPLLYAPRPHSAQGSSSKSTSLKGDMPMKPIRVPTPPLLYAPHPHAA